MMRFLAVLLILGACSYETTRSGTLTERGRVTQVVYVPERYEPSVGLDYEGRPTITTEYFAPVYVVVFECSHGQHEARRGHNFWRRFKRGDSVLISYEEVYHVDKKTQARTLWEYDFLDATPYRTPRETP